jgi:hypothetical protein
LRPILIRNLKRAFVIAPEWADTPFGALRAAPEIFGPEPAQEAIAVERLGRHFRVRTPSGRVLEGSMRELACRLDSAILREGLSADAGALVLPAAILREPGGGRIAFVGGRRSGKTWLSLLLLESGWRFEGDGWALARADGFVAAPRTIRVRDVPPNLSPEVRARIESAPLLQEDVRDNMRSVDPWRLAGDWTLRNGALEALFFLEINPGGRDSVRCLTPEEAFGRALALCQGDMSALSAALLRMAVAKPKAFRLRLGEAQRSVEIVAQALSRPETAL